MNRNHKPIQDLKLHQCHCNLVCLDFRIFFNDLENTMFDSHCHSDSRRAQGPHGRRYTNEWRRRQKSAYWVGVPVRWFFKVNIEGKCSEFCILQVCDLPPFLIRVLLLQLSSWCSVWFTRVVEEDDVKQSWRCVRLRDKMHIESDWIWENEDLDMRRSKINLKLNDTVMLLYIISILLCFAFLLSPSTQLC